MAVKGALSEAPVMETLEVLVPVPVVLGLVTVVLVLALIARVQALRLVRVLPLVMADLIVRRPSSLIHFRLVIRSLSR